MRMVTRSANPLRGEFATRDRGIFRDPVSRRPETLQRNSAKSAGTAVAVICAARAPCHDCHTQRHSPSAWRLFGAACATTILNVSSHVRPGIDIGQYRTFAWGPADALPTGDPRLDQNPYFQDYVQGAVEKQLAARGILASTTGTSDLLLHYHASIDTRIDVSRSEREYERCQELRLLVVGRAL